MSEETLLVKLWSESWVETPGTCTMKDIPEVLQTWLQNTKEYPNLQNTEYAFVFTFSCSLFITLKPAVRDL